MGGYALGGLKTTLESLEPLVGHRDDSQVAVDGGEGVVRNLGVSRRECVEQARLPDVGETNDSHRKHTSIVDPRSATW